MQPFLILIAGLVFLTVAGDLLVRGGVDIARRFGVPEMIVGLTIISLGTSAPELFVSLEAAIAGFPGLAIGNVVGSNIANVLLVLGLPALFAPIHLVEPGIRRSSLFMVAITVLMIGLGMDAMLSRIDGVILLALMAAYLGYSLIAAQNGRLPACEHETEEQRASLPKALLFMGVGFVGLFFGGQLTVNGALGIADNFGLAETAVGTTIVALGTSLPELAATLAASVRRSAGVAIGNIIGSNIFNILGILGLSAAFLPLRVDPGLFGFDVWVMLATSAVLIPLAFTRRPIAMKFGLLLILVYIGYLYVALGGTLPS